MPQPLFSIIVPCCNVGKYIAPLAQSIRNQQFTDYEVLLVVENSTDDTLEQCQRAAGNASNWHIFTQPRSGSPATPRNTGLDHATGKYALFVDGDDQLPTSNFQLPTSNFQLPTSNGALSVLAEQIKAHDEPDLVHFAMHAFSDTDDALPSYAGQVASDVTPEDDGKVLSGPEATCHLLRHLFSVNAMAQLNCCRIDFLNRHQLRFCPGLIHEDEEWTPRVLYLAQRVLLLNQPLYLYRKRAQSITSSKIHGRARIIATIFRRLITFALSQPSVSPEVWHSWQRYWLDILYSTIFIYKHEKNAEQFEALQIFLADAGAKNFWHFLRHCSWPKRIAGYLILLTNHKKSSRWLTPAIWYFKYLYYPLAIKLKPRQS